MEDVQEKIRAQVNEHPIVLYMKGTPRFPQCGFSQNAAAILQACGAKDYFSVDVLMDPEIRSGIKLFSNWPTLPQLYLKGQLIGGSDIMTEMYQSGELQKRVAEAMAG
ncbi:MAG: Grx4 family monothiol glutaredoxin [Magnetococcales bacterium]|nr:Grx4 family monothiol glutaredoxin [Magnetococcales bacterium]MBF0583180.1 Grx4 family monothiol glutaredoxin [Magnetococcales bacterium]